MIKSIWQIGEDGTGLGEEYHLTEECLGAVQEALTAEENDVLSSLLYSGHVFVLEESNEHPKGVTWEGLLTEANESAREVQVDELVKRLKEVIAEEQRYEED